MRKRTKLCVVIELDGRKFYMINHDAFPGQISGDVNADYILQ